jgi:hypothetical protein
MTHRAMRRLQRRTLSVSTKISLSNVTLSSKFSVSGLSLRKMLRNRLELRRFVRRWSGRSVKSRNKRDRSKLMRKIGKSTIITRFPFKY